MSEKVTALEIDLSDVRNEAETTGQTLKQLREEVKSLRSQLENTEVGTDSFISTLEELTNKQRELTSATKLGVEAQKGSYNDLTNQMSALKQQWKATADEMERANLGEEINRINNELKEMDATLGNHQRNVGNYESALDGVNTILKEQNSLFESSIGTIRGLMGTYQLIEGTVKAFGVDSEEATEAIQKMQGVMAMTEGLKAIQDGVKGFKQLKAAISASSVATNGFKKALVATGIGAIIVLVGTLAANWESITKWLSNAGVNMENFGKISRGVVKAVTKMFENLGKGLVKVFKGEFQEAGDYFKQAFSFAENYQEGVSEREIELIEKANKSKRELYISDQEFYIDMMEAKNGADWKYTQDGIKSYRALFEARAALYAKDTDEYKKNLLEQLNYERELREQKVGETFDIPKTEWAPVITEEQKEKYEKGLNEITGLKIQNDESLNKWVKEQNDKAAEERKKQQEEEERIQQRKIDVANATMSALSDIMKQGSAEQKAVQVAQTLMNTYTAAMGAAKDTTGPAWLRIAAIATVVAAGLAQVKNILAVDPNGETGNNNVSTNRTPSISALSMMQSGVQSTTMISGDSSITDVSDTKVYVLESDITKKQNDVKTTVAEATF